MKYLQQFSIRTIDFGSSLASVQYAPVFGRLEDSEIYNQTFYRYGGAINSIST